jgi:hypothetical protein
VAGTHVSDHERDGEILEVRGKDGTPPYVVRWFDTGHEALVFPGPDATIRPAEHGEEQAAGQSGDTEPPG